MTTNDVEIRVEQEGFGSEETVSEETSIDHDEIKKDLSQMDQLLTQFQNFQSNLGDFDEEELDKLKQHLLTEDEEDIKLLHKKIDDIFCNDLNENSDPTIDQLRELAVHLEYQIQDAKEILKEQLRDSHLPMEMKRQIKLQMNKQLEPLNKQYMSIKRVLLKFRKLEKAINTLKDEIKENENKKEVLPTE